MLGFIRGTILKSFVDGKHNVSLIVWPHQTLQEPGTAYKILVTQKTAMQYSQSASIELWVYTYQSDKESSLLGMDSSEKMGLFTKLLSVSGVGPKTALTIIDALSPGELKEAILTKDVSVFAKIPGVGKKTAGKIVLEFSGELVEDPTDSKESNGNNELISALKSLGYKQNEAQSVIEKAKKELASLAISASFEEKVRVLFRYL